MDIMKALEASGLIEGMSEEHVQLLASIAEHKIVQPGEIIVPEVNRSRDLYLLTRGRLIISLAVPREDRQEEVLDTLHPGQLCGELAFVDGSPRSATVKADVETEIFTLPHDKLNEAMEKDPKLGYLMMRNVATIIAGKLRQTNLAYRNQLMMW